MSLQKKDFVEIEFTGRTEDGIIFDSNIQKDLNEAKIKSQAKLFTFAIGEGMFLKGIDEYLIGKEIGKHKIELEPENAFGKRDSRLVQMIPIKQFHQQKINPVPGIVMNFDGRVGKILTVSGGRVMVDFNNPLSGKKVIYDLKIIRKVVDLNEKISAINNFLFQREFKFEVKDKKLIIETDSQMKRIVELFRNKYKEIIGLDLEVKDIKEKKENGEKPKNN
jgi:FKBP-type peptidyl-prolyl cis-trans isomerase SlyD